MKKMSAFLLVAVCSATLLFSACSRTKDAIGLDSITNIVRTSKWTVLTQTVYTPAASDVGVTSEWLADGKYLKFEANGKAWIYDKSGTQVSQHTYSFADTKTLIWDGVTYKIRENLVSTSATITAENETAVNKTVLVFKR